MLYHIDGSTKTEQGRSSCWACWYWKNWNN